MAEQKSKAEPGKSPSAPTPPPPPSTGKGRAFFDQAEQVAETGNWDYAIAMYLEGILREPENVVNGHQRLREVSLKRKAQGGKNAGLLEGMKRRPTKDPVTSLVNAEYLLAKEPGNSQHMEQVLKAAMALKHPDLIKWICDILSESQRLATKRNRRLLLVLTHAYKDISQYGPAMQVCELAKLMDPSDNATAELLRSLSADFTLKKGGYGQKGSFTKGVKDMEKQKELAQSDLITQSREYLEQQITRSRQDYLGSPTVAGKINAFVDALIKFEDESFENEAIDVLTKAHLDTKAYQFKLRIGDIRIRQMIRRTRKIKEAGDKAAYLEQLKRQLHFEMDEFAERAINYPTDLSIKFELGVRQLALGKYDEAIGSFQQAQRDPRRHLRALNYLGQAFSAKTMYHEAAETYERALNTELTEDRAKEIHYNFADVLEKMGDFKRAQEQFSEVAQIDYNYKDVRQRLENIRKKSAGQ